MISFYLLPLFKLQCTVCIVFVFNVIFKKGSANTTRGKHMDTGGLGFSGGSAGTLSNLNLLLLIIVYVPIILILITFFTVHIFVMLLIVVSPLWICWIWTIVFNVNIFMGFILYFFQTGKQMTFFLWNALVEKELVRFWRPSLLTMSLLAPTLSLMVGQPTNIWRR